MRVNKITECLQREKKISSKKNIRSNKNLGLKSLNKTVIDILSGDLKIQ